MHKPLDHDHHTDVDKRISDFMDRSLSRTISRSITEWLAPSTQSKETSPKEDIAYEQLQWSSNLKRA